MNIRLSIYLWNYCFPSRWSTSVIKQLKTDKVYLHDLGTSSLHGQWKHQRPLQSCPFHQSRFGCCLKNFEHLTPHSRVQCRFSAQPLCEGSTTWLSCYCHTLGNNCHQLSTQTNRDTKRKLLMSRQRICVLERPSRGGAILLMHQKHEHDQKTHSQIYEASEPRPASRPVCS